jgi:hypothetical protein
MLAEVEGCSESNTRLKVSVTCTFSSSAFFNRRWFQNVYSDTEFRKGKVSQPIGITISLQPLMLSLLLKSC